MPNHLMHHQCSHRAIFMDSAWKSALEMQRFRSVATDLSVTPRFELGSCSAKHLRLPLASGQNRQYSGSALNPMTRFTCSTAECGSLRDRRQSPEVGTSASPEVATPPSPELARAVFADFNQKRTARGRRVGRGWPPAACGRCASGGCGRWPRGCRGSRRC